MTESRWPSIIQGGMGVAVSTWPLARAVSRAGHLGVVSGTGIDTVLVRRLQDGDADGQMRRALAAAPWPDLVQSVLSRFFRPEGRRPGQAYASLPKWSLDTSRSRTSIGVLGGFVEVWLAKVGHPGLVGLNLMTKIALPNLAVLYGAMHAGVDVVLMGAGIPKEIPGALDTLAQHLPTRMRCDVVGIPSAEFPWIEFEPMDFDSEVSASLHRPAFFPIIASHSLATMLSRKANGSIEGFVVEGPTAGGHNAPPRGPKQFDAAGQPIYGPRDEVDLEALADLGYPFWLAGGMGSPTGLQYAQEHHATGIQVGTLFAFCRESGLASTLKQSVIDAVREECVTVFTDPLGSPTGFPFKVASVPATLSDPQRYRSRVRVCDVGYLREAYRDDKGRFQFRCAAEPVAAYVRKGGTVEETEGKKCLCNGLMAAAGFPQVSGDTEEAAIVTSGDGLDALRRLVSEGHEQYTAQEVLDYLTHTTLQQA